MQKAGEEVVAEKLDAVIALLRIIAKKEIDGLKKSILSTGKKQMIFDLCTGEKDNGEIAKEVGVSGEYVRLTLKDLEDAGFIIVKQSGAKRYPVRMI